MSLILLLLGVSTCAGGSARVDYNFLYALQHAPGDARSRAFAGAGCALPGPTGTALLNPALIYPFIRETGPVRFLAQAFYGRDTIWSRHTGSVSAALALEELGLVGGLYRYLSSDNPATLQEGALFYSGRLFEDNSSRGSVDFGMTVKYHHLDARLNQFDTLFSDSINYIERDTTRFDTATARRGRVRLHRLLVDIGLFQKKMSDNLDFGISFLDVFGYTWSEVSPRMRNSDSTYYNTEDSIVAYRDSLYYEDEFEPVKGVLDPKNKRVVAGITFSSRIVNNLVLLTIPADIELLGLFDKNWKARLMFRGGVEVTIRDFLMLRFGYARQPRYTWYTDGDLAFRSVHRFSGGGGVRFSRMGADFYFSADEWGFSLDGFY